MHDLFIEILHILGGLGLFAVLLTVLIAILQIMMGKK